MKDDKKIKELINKVELNEPTDDFNIRLMGKIINPKRLEYKPLLSKKIFYFIGFGIFLLAILSLSFSSDPINTNMFDNAVNSFTNGISLIIQLQETTFLTITLAIMLLFLIIDLIIHRIIDKNFHKN